MDCGRLVICPEPDRLSLLPDFARSLIFNQSVADSDYPMCVSGHIRIVRYQNDRDAFGVELLKHFQDFDAGVGIEVARGLVGHTNEGWLTSDRAMATRCCCPPDICEGSWSGDPPARDDPKGSRPDGGTRGDRPMGIIVQGHDHVLQGRSSGQEIKVLEYESDFRGSHHCPLVGHQTAHFLPVEPELA